MIDTTNRNAALASAVVEELARSGVRHAFLSPGSRSTPIALALDREPELELTVVLDERCAAFMALGTAVATGNPAVVACTSGSAAANLHPAVVEADQAGVPLIVLTSDRPPELRDVGTGQTINQIGLYGTAARWFCEVGTHDADDAGLLHMRSVACRAFGEAASGRGPVHLNLPWREPLGPEGRPGDVTASDRLALDGRSEGRPLTVPLGAREPGGELLDALADAVARSNRGLIVAGRHLDPGIASAVAALAEASGLPILAEPTSGVRFGLHPRRLVVSAYSAIAAAGPERLAPDLVLRFGDMPTSKPLRAWIAAGGADQIVVDAPGRWNEPTRRAGAMVRGDGASVARALAERVDTRDGSWSDAWVDAEERAQQAIDEVLGGNPAISEPSVHRALGGCFADGESVLLASSMPIRDAESFMRGGEAAVRLFSNRGANGIDGLVSTAAGVELGSSGPTWAILGDLAVQHDLGGVAALAALGTPLRLVVIDNGGGGIFDFLPQAGQIEPGRFERLFTTPGVLDFEQLAELFEIPYLPIEGIDDLPAIAEHDRVIAHARIPRDHNASLHAKVHAAVADALNQRAGG